MAVFYKGAGPGTHWWTTDARITGFTVGAAVAGAAGVIRHITQASHPSPYLSLTASYDVAVDYALMGPVGVATSAVPGYVYEVDLARLPSSHPVVVMEPVKEIASSLPPVGTVSRLAIHHDGPQNLILGIASRSLHGGLLAAPPRRPGTSAPRPPVIDRELEAIVFALRDAEDLLFGSLPAASIVDRHDVY